MVVFRPLLGQGGEARRERAMWQHARRPLAPGGMLAGIDGRREPKVGGVRRGGRAVDAVEMPGTKFYRYLVYFVVCFSATGGVGIVG